MLFHIVASVMLSMVTFSTIFLLTEIFNSQSESLKEMVSHKPWITKCMLTHERENKGVSVTGFKSGLAFG